MTDTQEALRQVSEALRDEALFDPGASTADTYNACKAFGTACSPENIAAILAHVEAQAAEIDRLTAALRAQPGPVSMADVEWAGKVHLAEAIRERDELRDVLLRAGFAPCDIPACNCGSWHHRYGLPERMQEIKDALAEAGHELSNANGNLTLNALKGLVAERDELRRQLAEARAEREAMLNALETMLIGACAVGVPHAGERQVLQEAVDSARAVINAARKEQA